MKLLSRLGISVRGGSAPEMHHCVMVHPKANIHRPADKVLDTSMVNKADQFRSWHGNFQDRSIGVTKVFSSLLNMRSADTLKAFAEKLARQHRPADLLALPDFMQPKPQATATPLPKATLVANPVAAQAPSVVDHSKDASPPPDRKRLVCAACGTKISYAEVKFCWNGEWRFAGQQYCREHQVAFS